MRYENQTHASAAPCMRPTSRVRCNVLQTGHRYTASRSRAVEPINHARLSAYVSDGMRFFFAQ